MLVVFCFAVLAVVGIGFWLSCLRIAVSAGGPKAAHVLLTTVFSALPLILTLFCWWSIYGGSAVYAWQALATSCSWASFCLLFGAVYYGYISEKTWLLPYGATENVAGWMGLLGFVILLGAFIINVVLTIHLMD